MLQITKQGNSIVVEGLNHYFYPYNGTLEVPCNSVITVVDEGDIVLFRSASNYDVLFSAKIDEITINGQSVTKDNVGEVFGALSNVSSGGGLTPEQEEKLNNAVQISDYNADKASQTTIDEAQTAEINKLKGDIEGKQDIIQDLNAIREGANLGKTALQEETDPIWTAEKVNYYTKTESDGIYATQVVVNEEIAARISDIREVKATLESKADKSEIPSLNGYATEQWVGEQGYLTEHQSLKTINGETIVGDGNIEISSGEQISDVLILPQDAEFTYKDGNKYKVVIRDISYNSIGGLDYTISIFKNGIMSTNTRKIGYIVKLSNSWTSISFDSSTNGYKISGHADIPDYVYIFSDDDNPIDENRMLFDIDIPLISGTNIKTINGESILGSGDIVISGGEEETDPVWTAEKVNYYTKTEVNTSLESKADKTEIPSLNGYATEQWVGQQGYLTQHQTLKTINGETIVGEGNITISGGEQISDVLILPQNVEFTYKDGNKYEVVIKDISYNSEGGLDYIILIKENGVVSTKTRKFGYMVKSSSSWVTYSFNSSAYGYKISNYSIPDYVYIFSDDDNPTDENKMYFDLDITLISGTTIKTINGESILGSGDIVISGGGEETDPVWTAEKVNYYTKTEINSSLETKANKSEIPTVPTNVSAFTNDAGYLTEHQSLSNYYTKSEIDGIVGNVNNALGEIING